MIEKVNPKHPDKIADRIAGAIVDLAYMKNSYPKVAVEALIGHGKCYIIIETSENITYDEVKKIVDRIVGYNVELNLTVVPQDVHLSKNQARAIKCGDNGIFKGVPLTYEEKMLSSIAKSIYERYSSDGKYILSDKGLIICQSNANSEELYNTYKSFHGDVIVNPLGESTGGLNVDSGAVNRKLGSDMAQSVTGGGLHGKDLSKADVSVNIYAFLNAQQTQQIVELTCAIGDDQIDGIPYRDIVAIAYQFVHEIGGFERLAEWGLF